MTQLLDRAHPSPTLELVNALRRLEQLDRSLCHATNLSGLEWQLHTPNGVRLLHLAGDDLAAPRTLVLADALQGYLRFHGVSLELRLPAAVEGAEITIIARHSGATLTVYTTDLTTALLDITLAHLARASQSAVNR